MRQGEDDPSAKGHVEICVKGGGISGGQEVEGMEGAAIGETLMSHPWRPLETRIEGFG